jgi:hypothetical protein
MMHAGASKRRLINVISLSFVSKLFSKKFLTILVHMFENCWRHVPIVSGANKTFMLINCTELIILI